MTRLVVTHSEAETMALGRELGATLQRGSTVLLRGELGAGKTAFVRGVAEGLELTDAEVSSPTFTLIQEYRGAVPLFHVDLYRISSAEADDLGLDEMNEQGVVAIEWSEKLAHAIAGAVTVSIEDRGGDERHVTIVEPCAADARYSER
jgi:tRNA threonylcarbamoyladenosine biosynthesis protein TsaE